MYWNEFKTYVYVYMEIYKLIYIFFAAVVLSKTKKLEEHWRKEKKKLLESHKKYIWSFCHQTPMSKESVFVQLVNAHGYFYLSANTANNIFYGCKYKLEFVIESRSHIIYSIYLFLCVSAYIYIYIYIYISENCSWPGKMGKMWTISIYSLRFVQTNGIYVYVNIGLFCDYETILTCIQIYGRI